MSESAQSKPTQSPTRPRGRPKVADVACLDAHLLSVGRELFFRHGYGAMTLSELAKIARVSKTTLYSRFPSKADLFRAIVMDQIRTWDTGPEHRPSESTTLLAALREYGDIVLRAGMTAEFIQMNRLLYSESGRFPELAELAAVRIERGVTYVAKQIGFFSIREGMPCRDPRAAAELFMAAVAGRASIATLTNTPISEDERMAWLDQAVRSFMLGRASW